MRGKNRKGGEWEERNKGLGEGITEGVKIAVRDSEIISIKT